MHQHLLQLVITLNVQDIPAGFTLLLLCIGKRFHLCSSGLARHTPRLTSTWCGHSWATTGCPLATCPWLPPVEHPTRSPVAQCLGCHVLLGGDVMSHEGSQSLSSDRQREIHCSSNSWWLEMAPDCMARAPGLGLSVEVCNACRLSRQIVKSSR